jgi:hypothetical protein
LSVSICRVNHLIGASDALAEGFGWALVSLSYLASRRFCIGGLIAANFAMLDLEEKEHQVAHQRAHAHAYEYVIGGVSHTPFDETDPRSPLLFAQYRRASFPSLRWEDVHCLFHQTSAVGQAAKSSTDGGRVNRLELLGLVESDPAMLVIL